jgi:hypothetical protein
MMIFRGSLLRFARDEMRKRVGSDRYIHGDKYIERKWRRKGEEEGKLRLRSRKKGRNA